MPADPPVVAREIASLQGMTIEALRAAWCERFGSPPYVRSGDFLRRCLAERIQLQAFGGDLELDRQLRTMVGAYRRSGAVTAPGPKLKTGAILIREYERQVHRVEVLAKGYLWQGRTHRSLSAIAREITGVRWNGPAFFGLRSDPGA
jgi:hypothetical protein